MDISKLNATSIAEPVALIQTARIAISQEVKDPTVRTQQVARIIEQQKTIRAAVEEIIDSIRNADSNNLSLDSEQTALLRALLNETQADFKTCYKVLANNKLQSLISLDDLD